MANSEAPASPVTPVTPVKHAVNGLWSETARLQEQIQKNYATTTQLLARANKLKERIVRQRQENQHALHLIDSPLRPSPTPAPESVSSATTPAETIATAPADASPVFETPTKAAAKAATTTASAGTQTPPPAQTQPASPPQDVAAEVDKPARGDEAADDEGLGHDADRSISVEDFTDAQAVYEAALEQRDGMITQLESDNVALQRTLKEYEEALEEIMDMHRNQVSVLQTKREEAIAALSEDLALERARNAQLSDKSLALEQQVEQMAAVMRQAADMEEAAELEASVRQSALERENAQLRELISAYDNELDVEFEDDVVEALANDDLLAAYDEPADSLQLAADDQPAAE
ncbi:uncharacterized protein AMSG_05422 [Thecamonas trahens ATCC 50062]|uniref:Uncharacterized protein n=1 Tax=Thecamonas trahens ATCC 50062 TaxID=461836 RepID=A0A0L0DDM9_THETB|nr:hypothetical protein AMSG_05422 [Thecamonas trahens ATCC 50062]KNC49418.1 hypothetical protein AMSG_05422 [Thecamonas trahens ATCC 50062]|eukprot:XP_013757842.1 hypothetical protein AMSG_05422 [Thecamonas trahens ATCC 50062]